jgi:hypothetical protein
MVELLRQAVRSAQPASSAADDVARARDASVARMYAEHPSFVRYARRVLLDPGQHDSRLAEALADFTLSQVRELRAAGISTSAAPEERQALAIVLRELGPRVLEDFVTRLWTHLTAGDASAGPPPEIEIRLRPRTQTRPGGQGDGALSASSVATRVASRRYRSRAAWRTARGGAPNQVRAARLSELCSE